MTIENSSLHISYIARFKEKEVVKLLMTEDRYMTYGQYKKHDLEYGHINKSAFDKLKRMIHRGTGEYLASKTKEEITASYKQYLLNLRKNRQEALADAERKLKECNDMIDYIDIEFKK